MISKPLPIPLPRKSELKKKKKNSILIHVIAFYLQTPKNETKLMMQCKSYLGECFHLWLWVCEGKWKLGKLFKSTLKIDSGGQR